MHKPATRKRRMSSRLKFASRLVARSAMQPMVGESRRPVLAQSSELGLTFIGHSSFLLQAGGKNLLIDPVFARWLVLLHRTRRPGVEIAQLPAIDAILLTHAHMDHLNRPSLRRIVRHTRLLTGKAPVAIVPWGVEDLVTDLGVRSVTALRWFESTQFGELNITMTPAKHWGARMLHDTHRGFGGYVIRGAECSLYHSGDTAYFDGFKEIRKRLAPEVALLPIGAYRPESFRNVHTSPEDALKAFGDLGARWMIPMHYGTFRLSEEPAEEPLQRLRAGARAAGIEEKLCVLEEGETKMFHRATMPSGARRLL
jgi:L-ascorbate metabolism protein UlaG (beta-lactamase superfamily)